MNKGSFFINLLETELKIVENYLIHTQIWPLDFRWWHPSIYSWILFFCFLLLGSFWMSYIISWMLSWFHFLLFNDNFTQSQRVLNYLLHYIFGCCTTFVASQNYKDWRSKVCCGDTRKEVGFWIISWVWMFRISLQMIFRWPTWLVLRLIFSTHDFFLNNILAWF